MNDSGLHHAIISSFLRDQRPPSVVELASHFHRSLPDARRGLRHLANQHGVVLDPRSDEIRVAHPFSAAPTPFVVSAGDCRWWGNCAWCSLGLAHLAGGTATIESRIGAIEDCVTIRVEEGRLIDRDFVVHFPVPMCKAWNNVIYACSVMLVFRNEAQVDDWCVSRGVRKGDVRPIEQIWEFAVEWYSRHADANWKKWSAQEAAGIFERHGLGGPIWALPEKRIRF